MPPELQQANFEIKCRCLDFETMRIRLARQGARRTGEQIQRDVYYKTSGVTTKLRIITDGPTYLVHYQRPDEKGVRKSNYSLKKVMLPLFSHLYHRFRFGVDLVVDKKRQIWKWKAVRVHLDRVAGLGTFLEIESVVEKAGSEEIAMKQCQEMIEALKLSEDSFLAGSYSEMLRARRRPK